MNWAGVRELLRPPPHRGPLIAAGAVPLAAGLTLAELRLDGSAGVRLAPLLVIGALLYWLGAQAPNEDGRPPAYQSVLLVTGLLLLYAGLLVTAVALGADARGTPAGALVWTSALACGLALWPALERNSAVCLLMAAIVFAVGLLSGWNWVFHPGSPTPYRWLLLALAFVLGLGALALREPAPRHSEQLVNAAGLAIAAIGVTALLSVLDDDAGVSGLWETVMLGGGLGLVAFGALERSPGPAYLGVVNLGLFVATAGQGETLYWWPLILLAAGAAMLAAGLRPRRPLPPEPPAYKAGEAPLAARADEGEIVVRVHDDSR
jgi:hypothetical protein